MGNRRKDWEDRMNRHDISKRLFDWYNDDKTCSEKPHCDVDECDLCVTCFNGLCKKFGLEYKNGEVVEADETHPT